MNNIVVDAIGELDDSIIERYFETKEELDKKKNKTTHFVFWKRLVLISACFALVVSSVVAIIIPKPDETQDKEGFKLPVSADEILWYTPSEMQDSSLEENIAWNGLSVSYDLNETLLRADDSQYIAIIVLNLNEENDKDFATEHYNLFKDAGYCVLLKETANWLFITKQDLANFTLDKSQYFFTQLDRKFYDLYIFA